MAGEHKAINGMMIEQSNPDKIERIVLNSTVDPATVLENEMDKHIVLASEGNLNYFLQPPWNLYSTVSKSVEINIKNIVEKHCRIYSTEFPRMVLLGQTTN